jgi:hypothetical protein
MAKMNTKTCDSCNHYDPILRGLHTGGHRETSAAWCAKRSVYPMKEGPGQVFPEGVDRVANRGDLAKPFIVRKGQVETACQLYQVKKQKLSKSDLLTMATKK